MMHSYPSTSTCQAFNSQGQMPGSRLHNRSEITPVESECTEVGPSFTQGELRLRTAGEGRFSPRRRCTCVGSWASPGNASCSFMGSFVARGPPRLIPPSEPGRWKWNAESEPGPLPAGDHLLLSGSLWLCGALHPAGDEWALGRCGKDQGRASSCPASGQV